MRADDHGVSLRWMAVVASCVALASCSDDDPSTTGTTTAGVGGVGGSAAAGGQAAHGGEGGSGGAARCADGTPLGQCAATGTSYCDVMGELREDESKSRVGRGNRPPGLSQNRT